ncbi:hypothetical protein GALL_440540 [mine drainage metagenome]|uniref:Uncharacterized protein n=1 Tax=mine drainage metagenome TaxID=410659 RepID=A0A1J5Q9Y0_9ZZZZ
MLDHQHGNSGGAHFSHQLDAGLRLDRRQPRQHLIEQQQFRFGGERARDFEATFLRRDQLAREHVGAGAEAAEFQHLVGLAARLAHMRGADQRADDDVVDHRHGLEAFHDLKGAPDPALAALRRRQRGDILAVKQDGPLRRRQHARDQIEQGRLAGAIAPEQRPALAAPNLQAQSAQQHALAARHVEVDAVEQPPPVELDAQPAHAEQRLSRHGAGPARRAAPRR